MPTPAERLGSLIPASGLQPGAPHHRPPHPLVPPHPHHPHLHHQHHAQHPAHAGLHHGPPNSRTALLADAKEGRKGTQGSSYATIVVNLVLHPVVFTVVYFVHAFLHRKWWNWARLSVVVVLLLTSVVLLMRACRRPSLWNYFLACGLVLATTSGAYFGNETYGIMGDIFTFNGMATYVNISPSEDSGLGHTDAGEIYFRDGSRIDASRAVAFKNTDIFCAAPIIMVDTDESGLETVQAAKSMDWWAAGVNCCTPGGDKFTCGDGSPTARAGTRMLNPANLPFFQFAVHQFTAKYHLPAEHPLFFYWETDPLAHVATDFLKARLAWGEACWSYVLVNAILVFCVFITLKN